VGDDFDRLVSEAADVPISGWDASWTAGRWIQHGTPWDYRATVSARLRTVDSLLDLGTGGGELLASMAPLPTRTFATEGYPPNLPVARRRLEPLGVHVIAIGADQRIDLPAGSVALVLDRHEAFDAREVFRVLVPGGTFVTQQVGIDNYDEIHRWFDVASAAPTNALESADALAREIASAGFRVVDHRESRVRDEFRDVGALAWFLRWAPWEVPGFSVDSARPILRRIHAEILRTGPFHVTAHRLLVVAERP
jgi:SAM-dependent methyltransferase